MMNMACTLFGLTPAEALAGSRATRRTALGPRRRGTLASGRAPTSRCGTFASPRSSRTDRRHACAGVVRAGVSPRRARMRLWTCTAATAPLVVDVPHAGRTFPDAIARG
jgi:hypothetical protein